LWPAASRPALGLTHPPVQWVPRALSPGGKARPGRDADHSPPSSAEVKKEHLNAPLWSVTGPLYLYLLSTGRGPKCALCPCRWLVGRHACTVQTKDITDTGTETAYCSLQGMFVVRTVSASVTAANDTLMIPLPVISTSLTNGRQAHGFVPVTVRGSRRKVHASYHGIFVRYLEQGGRD
jgi:hypothetical protein